MDNKIKELENLNRKLKLPQELGGVFLPEGSQKQFDFMFVAEMPSMNKPINWDGKSNYNFNVTERDRFLQEMMTKYGVGGSYVTDIVKKRDIARRPTKQEIKKWLPFLLKEIEIIRPKNIIVLGRRTYEGSFRPFVEPKLKRIKVNYVYHYSSQVQREGFEKRFKQVIKSIRKNIK